jgi:hypothetical protein
MPRRRLLFAFASVSLAIAAPAHAQNASSQAAAQALFDDARNLMNDGKFAEACPKFAESERLDPGAGTLLNLANCYEKNGQTASAWVTFKDAAAAADVKHRADWSQRARERSTALEPTLSRLTISVPQDARIAGLEIRRDGVLVGNAEWGTAIPVDPGDHGLEVIAPGKKKWTSTAKVGPKSDAVTVNVPVLEDEPKAVTPPPATTSPAQAATAQPVAPAAEPPPPAAHAGGTQRMVGIVLGGAGVAGLVVGGIFGGVASGKNSDAKRLCPTTQCTSAEGVKDNDDAKSAATVSTVAMVAGGALLAGGLVLFFTAPKGGNETAIQVAPAFGRGEAGLRIGGAF